MTITLTDEQAEVVRRRVASGKYRSEFDVVDEALRALVDDEMFDAAVESVGIETLRANVQAGLAELDRGEGVPWDSAEFLASAKQRHAERAKKAHA